MLEAFIKGRMILLTLLTSCFKILLTLLTSSFKYYYIIQQF